MTSPGLTEPQQERSRRSFAAVKDAALALMLEHGGPGFTLADVSAAASVSIGSIYGRVGNKATLLGLIQEEELDRFDTELAESLAWAAGVDAPFEDAVRGVVTAFVAPLTGNAPMIRAFMRLGDEGQEPAARGSRSWESGREAFCAALAAVARREGRAASAETLTWCHELVYSVTARHLGFGLSPGGRPVQAADLDQVAAALSRTVCLLLRA